MSTESIKNKETTSVHCFFSSIDANDERLQVLFQAVAVQELGPSLDIHMNLAKCELW